MGLRKDGKISTLQKLNDQLHLGLEKAEINDMTTSQLRKTIFEAKLKHGLHIKASCSLKRNMTNTSSEGEGK